MYLKKQIRMIRKDTKTIRILLNVLQKLMKTDLMQSTEVLLHHNLVIPEGTQVLPEDIKVIIILGQHLISINLGLVRGLHTTALSSMGQSRCTVKSPLAGRVRSR